MRLKTWFLLFIICPQLSWGQIITTVAGYGFYGGPPDTCSLTGENGPATLATICGALSVTVDKKGQLYIFDYGNGRIRKVDTAGIITTIAGHGAFGYGGDGGPATAAVFNEIGYLYVDRDTNLYLPDDVNYRLRLINLNTGIINTIAGTGIEGATGDGGAATLAKIGTPFGVHTDKAGNIYYADDAYGVVRKIDTNGNIYLVAGNFIDSFAGDGGPATLASINHTIDVTFDPKGNLYLVESFSNRIRKVDTAGIISTYAGNGGSGYTGDNGSATNATFNFLEGITSDGAGNIFIADAGNNVIRKIDTFGIITTVVGNGYGAGLIDSITLRPLGGFSGDGGPATAAELNSPCGVAFDVCGNLYIADLYNNRVRKVTNVGVPLKQSEVRREESLSIVSVYPNPANTLINFQFSTPVDATIKITNIEAQVLQTVPVNNATIATINIAGYAPGMYLYQVVTKAETQVGKVVKE